MSLGFLLVKLNYASVDLELASKLHYRYHQCEPLLVKLHNRHLIGVLTSLNCITTCNTRGIKRRNRAVSNNTKQQAHQVALTLHIKFDCSAYAFLKNLYQPWGFHFPALSTSTNLHHRGWTASSELVNANHALMVSSGVSSCSVPLVAH